MGCDIHMFAEVKKNYRNEKVAPAWETVGRVFKDDYHRNSEVPTLDSEGYEWNEKYTMHPYDGRNYNLFAVLADVRNGYGLEPIAEPRGVPTDASVYYRKSVEDYGEDGHSHSWFTLEELEAFDWSQPITQSGWVNPLEYEKFKKNGKPDSWSGGVGGGSVRHISNEEMDKVLQDKQYMKAYRKREWVEGQPSYYTVVEWTEPYTEAMGSFIDKTIPELKKLKKYKDVLDVRVVFYFDN